MSLALTPTIPLHVEVMTLGADELDEPEVAPQLCGARIAIVRAPAQASLHESRDRRCHAAAGRKYEPAN